VIDFDGTVLAACMGAFGETVTYMPQSGPLANITAVFTEKGRVTREVNGESIVEEVTSLGCQASQFSANPPDIDDIFVIRGRYWRVAESLPDGHGHIQLHVMLANDSQADITPTPPVSP
jgi:hypothetical protein